MVFCPEAGCGREGTLSPRLEPATMVRVMMGVGAIAHAQRGSDQKRTGVVGFPLENQVLAR